MSQYISRVLRSSCLRFVVTWFFQVRRLSKWSPRYLTASAWGTIVWLIYTGGECLRRRVNVMCEDLDSFIFSLHIRVQFSTVRRWSWRLAEAKAGSEWVVVIAVSSAKMLRIVLSGCGISAVYIVYNNWPKMLPWGTPENIGNGGEVSLLHAVTNYLFCKYDFRRLKYAGGTVCLIFSRRPWCHTLSNAWLTSKKTAEQYCWSSNALFIVSVRRWHCCIVEFAFRKPNWCRGIHSWKCVSLYILLSRSSSRILDITGKRLIGLYEVTSVGFFPRLWYHDNLCVF